MGQVYEVLDRELAQRVALPPPVLDKKAVIPIRDGFIPRTKCSWTLHLLLFVGKPALGLGSHGRSGSTCCSIIFRRIRPKMSSASWRITCAFGFTSRPRTRRGSIRWSCGSQKPARRDCPWRVHLGRRSRQKVSQVYQCPLQISSAVPTDVHGPRVAESLITKSPGQHSSAMTVCICIFVGRIGKLRPIVNRRSRRVTNHSCPNQPGMDGRARERPRKAMVSRPEAKQVGVGCCPI